MKFMNLKRFVSTVLACVLALSLAVPAFATNATNITGTYRALTLNVVVPTTGSAIINPYGLPYNVGESVISGQQITTGSALVVQNKSAVPLSVSASIASSTKGTFTFDANTIGASETANKGNVLFQMFEAPGVTEANVSDTDAINAKFAALKDEDALCNTVLSKTDLTAQTPVPAVEEDDIVTLKAADAEGNLVDGGAAFFRLSGTVAKKPTTAWVAADGFSSKITFTFEPTVETASAGTVAAAGDTTTLDASVNTDVVLTLTPALPNGVTVATWSWVSSSPAAATVAANDPTTTATVTHVATGSTKITVSGTGSDGKLYTASIDITCQ